MILSGSRSRTSLKGKAGNPEGKALKSNPSFVSRVAAVGGGEGGSWIALGRFEVGNLVNDGRGRGRGGGEGGADFDLGTIG